MLLCCYVMSSHDLTCFLKHGFRITVFRVTVSFLWIKLAENDNSDIFRTRMCRNFLGHEITVFNN